MRSTFNKLNLIVDGIPCIKIIDPEIKRILLEKLDKDGNSEINVRESENISFSNWFYQNKKIRTFNEAKKFKGLYIANNNAFAESSIEEIEFAAGQHLAGGAFYNCLNLRHIVLPPDMKRLDWLTNNPALEYLDLPETLETLYIGQLSNSGLKEITIPVSVINIEVGILSSCPNLEKIIVLPKVSSIGMKAFSENSKLKTFIIYAETPPTWGYNAFYGTNQQMKIYVPDAYVNAYKTASNWKSRADYIYPISQYIGQ